MRLLSFEVTGLFDRFNYRVALNQDARITILHSPNGFGKTTVLQMLGHAVAARFSALAKMPFHSFALHFDTRLKLEFTLEEHSEREDEAPRKAGSKSSKALRVTVDGHTGVIKPSSPKNRMRAAEMVERFAPHCERVAEDEWIDSRTGELVTLEMLMSQFGDELPPHWRDALERDQGDIARQVRTLLKDLLS